jgi:predicted dehydrogenase
VESLAVKMADEISSWQGKRPRVYTDVEAMLKAESDMMAVDIVTLHRSHHTVALPCFEAGKHVTIEKPLAITLRAGKLMLDAAAKTGKVFQVAENYRRSTENRAIKWAIDSGMIGKLRMIYWVDVEERLWYWTWRDHRDQAGGGWPLDGGVHFADLFRYHVGDPESLYCAVRTYNPLRYKDTENLTGTIPVDVEDTTLAVIQFAGGVTGSWTYTLSAPGDKWGHRAVYGEHGSLTWGAGFKSRKSVLTMEELIAEHHRAIGPDGVEKLFPRGIEDTIATELYEFTQAVLHGTPVEITGLEGFKDQAISMALYESDELNRPVSLAEVESLKAEAYQKRINAELEGVGK